MRTVLVGAGIAAAAGLLMGAAAKPDLAAGDRPEGPQILAGWSGVRSTGPFDDGATLASYNGQIPDYVLGTDWKRSLEPPRPAPEPRERLARNDLPPPDEDVGFTGGADEEPIRIEPRYPSTDGGLDLAAPEPISDEPDGIG